MLHSRGCKSQKPSLGNFFLDAPALVRSMIVVMSKSDRPKSFWNDQLVFQNPESERGLDHHHPGRRPSVRRRLPRWAFKLNISRRRRRQWHGWRPEWERERERIKFSTTEVNETFRYKDETFFCRLIIFFLWRFSAIFLHYNKIPPAYFSCCTIAFVVLKVGTQLSTCIEHTHVHVLL